MAYHDVRLSVDVERGAAGGPAFHTTVMLLPNGFEYRNQDQTYARHKWDISYGIMNQVGYSEVRAFFYARRGKAHTFRFRDWSDYTMTLQQIGVGTGALTTFQIVKSYETSGPDPYVRKITKPDSTTLSVYANGVLVDPADYTVGSTGLITFDVAPTNGHAITVTCEFDIHVRFDTDEAAVNLEWVNAGSIPDLPLIEVLE